MKKTLYIRTEANRITATGHMMRCISIATAAKKKNIATVFIVAQEESRALPESRGFEVICLDRKWDDFDGEIAVMEGLIDDRRIRVMLADSYFVTEKYMAAISKKVKLAYIDDLHERVWPCHTLINYAIYADLFDYEKEYHGLAGADKTAPAKGTDDGSDKTAPAKGTEHDSDKTAPEKGADASGQLLLGCRYCPLAEQYEDVPVKQVNEEVREVLVVTGGTDEFHFMRKFLSRTAEKENLKQIHFLCICGRFNMDLDYLKELAANCRYHNIQVEESLPTLKDAMQKADVMITAGGTTLYEMAATGTPSICFSLADNQFYNVEGFARHGLAVYAGDIRKDFDYDKLLCRLDELCRDWKLRQEMSLNLQKLVDGQGAGRIVDALLQNLE